MNVRVVEACSSDDRPSGLSDGRCGGGGDGGLGAGSVGLAGLEMEPED
jgi:hypothetical protein